MKMLIKSKMHPKNIYKTPPNFKELAISYPEFRKYVKQELSGKMTIDYQDPNAVKELTCTLLKKDFNLHVEINETHLIPRVPLCLNYILWVEDLLSALNKSNDISGIDIGTGNISIYSLLATTKGWRMFATEVDSENYFNALNNIMKNNLENKITLKLVSNTNVLLCGIIDERTEYDFCMCNPPFFAHNEKPQNRTSRRIQLETIASESPIEVITEGGELSFIKRLIEESDKIKTQVRIYTTLVGKKSDFLQLKKEVQKVNPKSVAHTEFCQGRTTRWGLAWTFCDINLKNTSEKEFNKTKKNKSKPLMYTLPENMDSFVSAHESMKNILNELKIQYSEESFDNEYLLYFKAFENTWSHQRRKKRMQAKGEGNSENHNSKNDEPETKKLKLEESLVEKEKILIVEGTICLKKEDSLIVFEMSWICGNKESLHQIFQYFKNKWTTQSPNI